MNKVTQAVIDLGGKFPKLDRGKSNDGEPLLLLCIKPNKLANIGDYRNGSVGFSARHYTLICTRDEFEQERNLLLHDWFSSGSNIPFKEWLKTKQQPQTEEDDRRIDIVGSNGPIGEHYKSHPSGIECTQITDHMCFNLGNALERIWRCDKKLNAIEDLRKAKWYIEREIAKRESSNE